MHECLPATLPPAHRPPSLQCEGSKDTKERFNASVMCGSSRDLWALLMTMGISLALACLCRAEWVMRPVPPEWRENGGGMAGGENGDMVTGRERGGGTVTDRLTDRLPDHSKHYPGH